MAGETCAKGRQYGQNGIHPDEVTDDVNDPILDAIRRLVRDAQQDQLGAQAEDSPVEPAGGAVPSAPESESNPPVVEALVTDLVARARQELDMDDRKRSAAGYAADFREFTARPLSFTGCAFLLLLARFLQRPDAPRVIAVGMLSYFFIAWPWLLPALVLATVIVAGVVGYWLGAERITKLVFAWHTRLRRRDPQKAKRIRRRAARMSRRLSKLIERLPDSWTTGLYLPDFEEIPDLPEKMLSDPFDRLAKQLRETPLTEADPGMMANG
jgi:hypothetical protein